MLRFVAFEESTSTNDFPITRPSGKIGAHLTSTLPRGRNRIIPIIGEALSLRPDSGIKNTNDDVRGVVRVGPEPGPVSEAQEVWGPSSVEVVGPVGGDVEDGGVAAELGGLGGGERGGEGEGGVGVGVEDGGGGGGERVEDGGVVGVVGEGEGLVGF